MFGWLRRRVVRARRLVLEDDAGRDRAVLEIDAAGNTVLRFHEANGAVRMFLGLTPDGTPRLSLRYAKDRGSIELEANDKLDSAACLIAGPSGQVQVILGIAKNGYPALALLDSDGHIIYQAEGPPEGSDGESFDWDSILRDPLW